MKVEIGQLIKGRRERAGLSQAELASSLGWDHHQTVGAIEAGKREVKAWELAQLASVLNCNLADLLPTTDAPPARPFVLWRDRPSANSALAEERFIKRCDDYHFLESQLHEERRTATPLPFKAVDLASFSFSDAYVLAEEVRTALGLGEFPAETLVKTLEDKGGVKFFTFQMDGGGSAATSKTESGICILVNSEEPSWRQHFSIAHELFHAVTWDESLFRQLEENEGLRTLNEKLANAFAAGLLMPTETLRREVRHVTEGGKIRYAALVAIARHFEVSTEALLWRLVNLRILDSSAVKVILNDPMLKELDRQSKDSAREPFLSERFIRLAYLALQFGKISRARLAELLSIPLIDLPEFLVARGLAEVEDNGVAVNIA